MTDRQILLSGTIGSRLYGTNSSDSDTDTMSICIRPARDYLLGFNTASWVEGENTIYELRFFLKLAAAANLNVLPALWVETWTHCLGRLGLDVVSLRTQRNRFLSKALYNTGTGYALQQLADVENENRGHSGKLGEKRKALIELHGYDTKAAMHTVRLARMTREYLRSPADGLMVRRPDSDELLAIRNGEWKKEAVIKEVRGLIADCDKLIKTTTAPEQPDRKWIDDFLIGVLSRHIKESL